MLLEDATGQASVDLFLRGLRFEFPVRDIVGIPGGMVRADEPYEEGTLAVLLHELEHIFTLTRPIGPIFTALAVRAHDLRNEMAAKFRRVTERFAAGVPGGEPYPESLNDELSAAVFAAIKQAEMARTVHCFAELMAPLLEGLALMAEFEVTGDWTWHTVLNMEYLHWTHFLFLDDRDAYASAMGESREEAVGLLYDALEQQIAAAREIRRNESSVDRMFFDQGDRDSVRTAPYFYGYLFFVRLFQEWKRRLPSLDMHTFFHGAVGWAGLVVPLTLLPALSVDHKTLKNSSRLLPGLFGDLLRDALSLPAPQIEQLLSRSGPLVWIYGEKHFAIPEWYRDGVRFYHNLTAQLMVTVFGFKSADEEVFKTVEVIDTLEAAKAMVHTASRQVYVVAVDDELHALLIAEKDRIKGGEVGRDGATWFRFAEEGTYQIFLSRADDKTEPLQRVSLGSGQMKVSGKRFVPAGLLTYLYFWPHGLPGAGEKLRRPISLVRVLLHGEGDERRAFVDAGGEDTKRVGKLVRDRDEANRLLDAVARALSPDYSDVRYALGELEVLAEEGSMAKVMASAFMATFPPDDLDRLRASCREVYCRVLFPAADEPSVTAKRFDLLRADIGEAARKTLRDCLHRGLMLTHNRRCEAKAGEEEAFDVIRQAALKSFGVPLVRKGANGLEPDLAG